MTDALTIEQQQALAMASARKRQAEAGGSPPGSEPTLTDNPVTTGLYHGVTGLATLPGNADDMARHVGHWLAEKIAGHPLDMPARLTGPEMLGKVAPYGAILPTQPELESKIPIKPYEAKGDLGKIVEGVSSFVPGALAMPAKSVADVAGNLAKYAVTPELAGKTARTGAEFVGASPATQDIAETVGQVAGAGMGVLKSRPAAVPIATPEEVATGVDNFFTAARAKGIVYKPDIYRDFVNHVGQQASKMKVNPTNFPGATAIIKSMEEMAGSAPDLEELYQLRQQAGGVVNAAARSGNSNDLRGAMMIKKNIDDFFALDSPERVQAGDPSGVGDLLKQGQKLRVQQDKMEIVQDAYRNAELSRVGQTDMDTALSNEFRKIAKSRDFGKFSAEEQAAIEEVVKKSKTEKVGAFLEQFANPRSPRTALIGSGVGAAAAVGAGIPWQIGAAIPPALGVAGRAIAQGVTGKQAAQVEQMLSGGAMRPPWEAAKRGYIPLSVPLGNMATMPPPSR